MDRVVKGPVGIIDVAGGIVEMEGVLWGAAPETFLILRGARPTRAVDTAMPSAASEEKLAR